jgi:hypothetical protein
MLDEKMDDAVVRYFTDYRREIEQSWHGSKLQKEAAWNYVYSKVPAAKVYHHAFIEKTKLLGRYPKQEEMTEAERLGKLMNDKVAGSLGGFPKKSRNGRSHRLTDLGKQKEERYRKLADQLDYVPSDKAISILLSLSLDDVLECRTRVINKGYRFEHVELPGKDQNSSWKVTERPFDNVELAKELAKALDRDKDLREMLVEYLRDGRNAK